jgi:hypothetical protein
MSFIVRTISIKSSSFPSRFKVVEYPEQQSSDGGGGEEPKEKKWMVEDGTCFRSFSYGGGFNHVDIEGIGEPFSWGEKQKVFIEFEVTNMLQPIKGVVKFSQVGSDDNWKDFPDMIEIEPKDETDDTGKITKRVEGKVQKKAFLLLATRSDDDLSEYNKKKTGEEDKEDLEEKESDGDPSSFTPLQKCNTNVIMMISQMSGIPVVFPMPWFGSLYSNDSFTNS